MQVEYFLVTVLVTVGASLAIGACGLLLAQFYFFQQAVLLFPLP